jgi:hemolysin activation/secretion protein
MASGLFLGVGGGKTYAYMQLAAETRRTTSTGDWNNGIGSARVLLYHRLAENQTLQADLEYGGGWSTTRPFELDLGNADGGVRGYGDSHDAGGSRLALKLEDNWFLGSLMSRADIGVAAFVDAGQVWAGDIPFGTTTPVKVGVGVGLLVASPVGSRRTFRIDLAVPVSPDNFAKWQVRVSLVNITQLGAFREPADVAFGREFIGRAMDFTYPR